MPHRDAQVFFLQNNPKRRFGRDGKEKASYLRYEKYKTAQTYGEFLDKGGKAADWRWDSERAFCRTMPASFSAIEAAIRRQASFAEAWNDLEARGLADEAWEWLGGEGEPGVDQRLVVATKPQKYEVPLPLEASGQREDITSEGLAGEGGEDRRRQGGAQQRQAEDRLTPSAGAPETART